MSNQPLVSVLMTAFNREQFIAEAIESVLGSTYYNLELIILDDCSTDTTFSIASSYEKKDKRVSVFRNEYNLKDYPNRNKVATYAKGKYIKYLDSDDKIYPGGLEYCVGSMEKYPNAAIGMVFYNREDLEDYSFCWDAEKVIRYHFFSQGCLNIGPSGSIIRRDVFEEIGGFDTRFGVASDNFFNIFIASKYPVVFLPQDFFYYRLHDGQELKDKTGYIKFNYLYQKELLEEAILPLNEIEILQLKKRVEKSIAKELIRYLIQTKKASSVISIMKDTGFSILDIFRSLLN